MLNYKLSSYFFISCS